MSFTAHLASWTSLTCRSQKWTPSRLYCTRYLTRQTQTSQLAYPFLPNLPRYNSYEVSAKCLLVSYGRFVGACGPILMLSGSSPTPLWRPWIRMPTPGSANISRRPAYGLHNLEAVVLVIIQYTLVMREPRYTLGDLLLEPPRLLSVGAELLVHVLPVFTQYTDLSPRRLWEDDDCSIHDSV